MNLKYVSIAEACLRIDYTVNSNLDCLELKKIENYLPHRDKYEVTVKGTNNIICTVDVDKSNEGETIGLDLWFEYDVNDYEGWLTDYSQDIYKTTNKYQLEYKRKRISFKTFMDALEHRIISARYEYEVYKQLTPDQN